MPKQVIIPPGTTAPIAPFVPGTLADGVVSHENLLAQALGVRVGQPVQALVKLLLGPA